MTDAEVRSLGAAVRHHVESPNGIRVPTADDVRGWPVTVDVPTAGRCFGLGRDASYDLARLGEFPVPVLKLGTALRVTRGSLLAYLDITDCACATTVQTPNNAAFAQVNRAASSPESDARPKFGAA